MLYLAAVKLNEKENDLVCLSVHNKKADAYSRALQEMTMSWTPAGSKIIIKKVNDRFFERSEKTYWFTACVVDQNNKIIELKTFDNPQEAMARAKEEFESWYDGAYKTYHVEIKEGLFQATLKKRDLNNIIITHDFAWAEDDVIDTVEKKEIVKALKKMGLRVSDSDYSYIREADTGYAILTVPGNYSVEICFVLADYEYDGTSVCEDDIIYKDFDQDCEVVVWKYGQKLDVKKVVKKLKKLLKQSKAL